MKQRNKGGIYLEQNKQPALDKEIRFLRENQQVRKINLPPIIQPEYASPSEIISYAKEAGIVDESDGQPLYQKLTLGAQNHITHLIVDCLDDEPYISSQISLLLQNTEEVVAGMLLAARSIGATKIEIQVDEETLPKQFKLPVTSESITLRVLRSIYPSEYYSQRHGKGLRIGVCALFYLARAIYHLERQSDCVVTVVGDCIANPGNYRVPLDMNIAEVLTIVGTIADPHLLVSGGSMTGYAITDPHHYKTSSTTRGILAFYNTYRDYGHSCIGCGRCTEVCPEGLSPYFIYQLMLHKDHRGLQICDADLCTSCGTCSYICPAKLDLAQIVTTCGHLIKEQRGKKDEAKS